MSTGTPSERHTFPTTHWSNVFAASQAETRMGLEALDKLIRLYQPSLKTYLVYQRRLTEVDADDVLQGFCATKILGKGLISKADPKRGKFRSLLLTALSNYLTNFVRDGQANRRAPPGGFVSFDEIEGHEPWMDPTDTPSASDVVWARTLLNETCRRMQEECLEKEQLDIWEVFSGRILRPAFEDIPPLDYSDLVRRFGFASPDKASNALISAKRKFERKLREVISDYAQDGREVEEEIRTFIEILSRVRAWPEENPGKEESDSSVV